MYAARPLVLELTGGEIWSKSDYFTQTILKDYLALYNPDFKIVWDARGSLNEPHTGKSIPLGGRAVMNYIDSWCSDFDVAPTFDPQALIATKGPGLRYNTALWIEKEGFAPILEDAGIDKRYDMTIMSTKGMTVKAAVEVAQHLENEGVRILVAHDFDKSGFEIVNTIRRGTRLLHGGADVVDLGLRLEDIEGLESEPVSYKQKKDPQKSLYDCGATQEEADFLVSGNPWYGHWTGQRVELNAMTSDQLIDWLEKKLTEHEVEKVVPSENVLALGYQRAVVRLSVADLIEEFTDNMDDVAVVDGLDTRVRDHLEEHPEQTWERALAAIAESERTDGA